MILFHGTTHRRAERICEVGFLPRKPSRRVWFAAGRGYAEGRARTQARRAHDRPAVLTCDIDLPQLRRRLGAKRVVHRGGIVAVDGPVPVSVIRSHPGCEWPTRPEELALWVNDILRLKPWKGVGRNHRGILRLSRWVTSHLRANPDTRHFPDAEVLALAKQWLPEFFEGVEVDAERLHARRRPPQTDLAREAPEVEPDPREDEALDLMASDKPRRRWRGLRLVAEMGDPDLADWCGMFLEDESVEVVVEALRLLRQCEAANLEALKPLGDNRDKRVRAAAIATLAWHAGGDAPHWINLGRAAIATLAWHAGGDAPHWINLGLRDPEPCVRMETVGAMDELDPTRHRSLFQIALYDPNPDVARKARELTRGKGYTKKMWPAAALRPVREA